jgi:hypothetical protein
LTIFEPGGSFGNAFRLPAPEGGDGIASTYDTRSVRIRYLPCLLRAVN